MRPFKDLNVFHQPADSKKHFPGTVVNIQELVNLSIVVKDFEIIIRTETFVKDRTKYIFSR